MISNSIGSFLIASVLLTISPGPDIIYVLVRSISSGFRSGIAVSAGLVSGIIVHTTLVAFGVSTLISSDPDLFFVIKLLGAGYMLYLAYKVFRSKKNMVSFSDGQLLNKHYFSLYKEGFVMNVVNPKVLLFFLSFFPGFLWDKQSDTIVQFYVLGALFILQAFVIFSMVSLFAHTIKSRLEHNSRVSNIMKWLQIVVFLGIAIFILS